MTYREWKIRKCLRLARNWVLFLAACGGAVALMATGILWLLPKAHALIAGPVPFTARNYDSSSYVFDAADDRLVVVNANLALEEEPAPELAVADDATGEQLEAEAASAYRSMAEAAQADGVELNLVLGNLCSLLRQNLSGSCINHILSQNVTYDTVLKVKLFIEFITTYLCQIVAAWIEEHAV